MTKLHLLLSMVLITGCGTKTTSSSPSIQLDLAGAWQLDCFYLGNNTYGNGQGQYRQVLIEFLNSTISITSNEHGSSSCLTDDARESVYMTGSYSLSSSNIDISLTKGAVTPKSNFDLSYWKAYCSSLSFTLNQSTDASSCKEISIRLRDWFDIVEIKNESLLHFGKGADFSGSIIFGGIDSGSRPSTYDESIAFKKK